MLRATLSLALRYPSAAHPLPIRSSIILFTRGHVGACTGALPESIAGLVNLKSLNLTRIDLTGELF